MSRCGGPTQYHRPCRRRRNGLFARCQDHGFTLVTVTDLAGLALFGAFGAAVQQAIDDPGERLPAVVTFLVAASGIAVLGVSAAFWALVAGLLVRTVLHAGRPPRG